MKKLLGIVVLGLMLQGCSGPPPTIYKNSSFKGNIPTGWYVVTEDPWAKSEYSEVVSVANDKCQSLGKGDAIMKPSISRGVFPEMVYIDHLFYCKKDQEKVKRAVAIASGDIEFTIKDKKEQCTAIGFEPATEKFADCVLRLVELDVKTQQTNQIALAQSQGNQQIADQLKKQSNDQSSQYFLDLSQKLLNPQSTVSAPSTSTCTISGGVYKNISCW